MRAAQWWLRVFVFRLASPEARSQYRYDAVLESKSATESEPMSAGGDWRAVGGSVGGLLLVALIVALICRAKRSSSGGDSDARLAAG